MHFVSKVQKFWLSFERSPTLPLGDFRLKFKLQNGLLQFGRSPKQFLLFPMRHFKRLRAHYAGIFVFLSEILGDRQRYAFSHRATLNCQLTLFVVRTGAIYPLSNFLHSFLINENNFDKCVRIVLSLKSYTTVIKCYKNVILSTFIKCYKTVATIRRTESSIKIASIVSVSAASQGT